MANKFDKILGELREADTGGGGTPGGSNTQVQFNNGGAFGGDSGFIWDNTNKRQGIGTNVPISALHIRKDNAGAVGAQLTLQSVDATGVVGNASQIAFLGAPSGNNTILGSITSVNTGGASYTSDMVFSTYSVGEAMRLKSNGDMTVAGGLAIGGAFSLKSAQGLVIEDPTAMVAGVGGIIQLGYKYTTGGAYLDLVKIAANKINGTSGNYDTGITFYTTGTSQMQYNRRVMDMLPNGNVGIGVVTPSEILDVAGNIKATGYKSSDGSAGATGSFTSSDGKTITVKNGLITGIV